MNSISKNKNTVGYKHSALFAEDSLIKLRQEKSEKWLSDPDFVQSNYALSTSSRSVTAGSPNQYVDYGSAKKLIQALGILSFRQWKQVCIENRIPSCVPVDPQAFYTQEGTWVSYEDFFGLPRDPLRIDTSDSEMSCVSYDEAKRWACGLGLKSASEWREYVMQNEVPPNYPRSPNIAYSTEFTDRGGWNAFLGNH